MTDRRSMQIEDWMKAAFNVVIGLFLGLALDALLRLLAAGAWGMAMAVVIPSLGFVLFVLVFDGAMGKLFDRFLPSGVRPARKPAATDRKPLGRLLSLPAGIVVGVILARLGLTNDILGLFGG